MECASAAAVVISSIILLVPNTALLVYADGAQERNCTAGSSDPSCIDLDKIGHGKEIPPRDKPKNRKPDAASDKYGLVPPFLGAASAVIAIYIVVHCLYLHCYAKKKMERMAQRNALQSQTPATIVMTDHPSSASMQPMTPLVKYEGAYGKTEVLQPQPYFMRSASNQHTAGQGPGQETVSSAGSGGESGKLFQSPPSPKAMEIIKTGAKRTSSLLSSIKSRSSKKSSSRMSTSSVGTDVSISLNEQEVLLRAQRASLDQGVTPAIKTNVCFVPFGKTVSELQANESSEWIPVQGYIYNPKGQENGNLNSGLGSLQNCASQIVFIPMSTPLKDSTAEKDEAAANNKEMEVFPEESESAEGAAENQPLMKDNQVKQEMDSASDTHVSPRTANVMVEVHTSPPAPAAADAAVAVDT